MGQISGYREAPYQGVSQAPPQVRLTTQAEALENSLVTIPQGWNKRPPFEWHGILEDHPGDTDGIFERAQTSGDDILLTLTYEGGSAVPRVYNRSDLSQETVTVSAPAQDYLDYGLPSPYPEIGATTVVDYTFLCNRNLEVMNSADTAPSRNPEGLIWVRQSAYGRTYKVTITPSGGSPVTCTLKTPTGATAASADWVDTNVIAASLISGTYTATDGATISGNLTALPGTFTVTRIGPVISVVASVDFTIKVEDGQAGAALVAVKGEVQTFSDLPKIAPDGFTTRIVQNAGTSRDDYYVAFDETAGVGTGLWKETIAPGAALGVDPETMPVGLFNSSGWQIDVLDWGQRTTGNEELIPDPNFIGKKIQHVAYWRNRLALVAGEGVTLSATDDPFRTYPSTLAAVLDSDPIERVNPGKSTTTFYYALPFESRLVLWGPKLQCEVTAQGVLKPSTCDIDEMTSHEFNFRVEPVKAHSKAYFLAPKGIDRVTSLPINSAVYELQIDLVSTVAEGEDLTSAIPTYLPGTIDRVALCEVNFLGAYGTSGEDAIYVHLFRYAEGQRVQNGFSRWRLPDGYSLGGMFFDNTTLFVLACREGEAHLISLETSPGVLDPSSTLLLTRLDFRCTEASLSPSYDAGTDTTLFTLPWTPGDPDAVRITVRAPGETDRPEGLLLDLVQQGSDFEAEGDWSSCPLYAGLAYEARWDVSTIYKYGQDNRPDRSGRLQLRKLVADYVDTGYLRVEVAMPGKEARLTVFEGLILNDPSASSTDVAPAASGLLSVGIKGRNELTSIAFVNDSHFGSNVPGFHWTGEFDARSGRL